MSRILPSPRLGPRDRWVTIFILALTSSALASLAFGGCDPGSTTPRRGGAGESCQTTNDCVAPLSCVANVCVESGDGGTSSSSSSSSGFDAGPFSDAGFSNVCDDCLNSKCEPAISACDAECIAVEACIETQCKHLGEINSPDEGMCFANCQGKHPSGKDTHLDVANCSLSNVCSPPCVPYPQDYEDCRIAVDNAVCGPARVACEVSLDCQAYNECVSTCGTLSECLACDNTEEAKAGRKLREDYETCVAYECIAESWLPGF